MNRDEKLNPFTYENKELLTECALEAKQAGIARIDRQPRPSVPPPPPLKAVESNDATKSDSKKHSSAPKNPPANPNAGQYGLEQVIQLMSELPKRGDMAVISETVKACLKSAQVDIGIIIKEAKAKEAQIDTTLSTIQLEIQQLHDQIAEKKSAYLAQQDTQSEIRQIIRYFVGTPCKNDIPKAENKARTEKFDQAG